MIFSLGKTKDKTELEFSTKKSPFMQWHPRFIWFPSIFEIDGTKYFYWFDVIWRKGISYNRYSNKILFEYDELGPKTREKLKVFEGRFGDAPPNIIKIIKSTGEFPTFGKWKINDKDAA